MRGVEIELLGPVQHPLTPLVVGHHPCHRERAGHTGEQHHRLAFALVLVLTRHVLRDQFDVLAEYSLKGGSRGARTPSYLRREGGKRTPLGGVATMLGVEVGPNEGLQFASRRRLRNDRSKLATNLLETVLERVCEEILFAVEMTVKAAVRESQIPHEIADRCPFTSTAPEPTRRRLDDAFARLFFVPGWISHHATGMDDTCHLMVVSNPDFARF